MIKLHPNLLAAFPILLLSLSACGRLESEKIAPAKTSGIKSNGSDPALAQFAKDCQISQGRLAENGTICLTKQSMELKSAETLNGASEVVIDANLSHGKFVVASANASFNLNAVDLVYNGSPFSKVPARLMANLKSLPSPGRLSFYVNATNYKDVTVTVWTCFQRTMQARVDCLDKYIP